jgi:hypothetical protein
MRFNTSSELPFYISCLYPITTINSNTLNVHSWVHKSNARNISVKLPLTQLAKMLCLPYYAYVFSSTKSVIRAERDLPGTEGGEGKDGEWGQGGEMTQTMYAHVNK